MWEKVSNKTENGDRIVKQIIMAFFITINIKKCYQILNWIGFLFRLNSHFQFKITNKLLATHKHKHIIQQCKINILINMPNIVN
jgi:hypothetical protein